MLRDSQGHGHVTAARLQTSAAAHHRQPLAYTRGDSDADIPELLLPQQQDLRLLPLGQHDDVQQQQPLTYDELQDARRLTSAANKLWHSEERRLTMLKRKWPFDPHPDATVSAVEHARRGTFQQLLQTDGETTSDQPQSGTATEPDVAAAEAAAAAETANAVAEGAVALAGESATAADDGDTQPKKRRKTKADRKREALGLPLLPPAAPAGTWTCINVWREATATADELTAAAAQLAIQACQLSRLVPCSHVNSVADASCEACGAARWDGDNGQLSARVRAILQTSDLNATTLKGVLRRLAAESGNVPAAGLQFARADVQREVDRQLALGQQRTAAAAHAQPAPADADSKQAAAQSQQLHRGPLVSQAATSLRSSSVLLAQQQASDRVLRRLAAVQALTSPTPAGSDSGSAAAPAAAAADDGAVSGNTGAAAGQAGVDEEVAAGDGTAAAEAATTQAADEAVDVAADWQPEPERVAPQAGLMEMDAPTAEMALVEQRAICEAADAARLRSAQHHGCNFAVTLVETMLHRQVAPKKASMVMRHLAPDRKFMGVSVACGSADEESEDSGSAASIAATDASVAAQLRPQQLAGFGGSSSLVAAGLSGREAEPDTTRRPLLLNPAPPGGDAAPVPAARTLPAATLEAVYRRLPHYPSHLDRHPMSRTQSAAENGLGAQAADGSTDAPAGSYVNHSMSAGQQRQLQAAESGSTSRQRDAMDNSPADGERSSNRCSAFTATGAHGQPPPSASQDAGRERPASQAPHNLFCVTGHKRDAVSFWYEDESFSGPLGSLHKYTPPPELHVSAVAQRREETLDSLAPQLSSLPADVRAVFEAGAEMGLPPCLLRDVLRRYVALGPPPVAAQQLQAEAQHMAQDGVAAYADDERHG